MLVECLQENRALRSVLERVKELPHPVPVVDRELPHVDNYDDFQYVDCPYDDYQDK